MQMVPFHFVAAQPACHFSPAAQSSRPMSETNPTAQAPRKRESMLANILCNVVIPAGLLVKGQAWFHMVPWVVLTASLAFPFVYFFYDLFNRGRRNIISIICFVSVLITGGVGLFKLPAELIVIKEAVVPSLFGLVIIGSAWTRYPLVKAFLLNPDFFDVERIEKTVKERGAEKAFEGTMRRGTWLLSVSFFFSAVVNFLLARWIIKSPSGTEAFNVELGKLHVLSYPCVALPATVIGMFALWQVVKGIREQTGLTLEDIAVGVEPEKTDEAK